MSIESMKLPDVVKLYIELKTQTEEFEKVLKASKQRVDAYKTHILEQLKEQGIKTLKVDGVGSVTMEVREQWKYPKDIPSRKLFNSWVINNTTAEHLLTCITMSSTEIKKLINEHKESKGLDLDERMTVPGLSDPFVLEVLKTRKGG